LPPIAGAPDGITVTIATGPSLNFCCISGEAMLFWSTQYGTLYVPLAAFFRAARRPSSSGVLLKSVLCQGNTIQTSALRIQTSAAETRIGIQRSRMLMTTPFNWFF
jgi:hypothetical protein